MKIYLSETGRPETEQTLYIPGWKSEINVLILVHFAFFVIYALTRWLGWLDIPLNDGTIGDFVNYFFALPGDAKTTHAGWLSGILIHQFVHVSLFEFVISMSALWFFGHILKTLIGERKVIILYLATIVISAVAFILSHYVFKIFSGHGTIMEGAFAGALGVMTTTVAFFKSHQIRVFGRIFFQLWQIYAVVLLISLTLLFKPSIAYAIVYLSSIWIGGQYAISRIGKVSGEW